jgi:hypothetical protein
MLPLAQHLLANTYASPTDDGVSNQLTLQTFISHITLSEELRLTKQLDSWQTKGPGVSYTQGPFSWFAFRN